jgi:hypothetical protein
MSLWNRIACTIAVVLLLSLTLGWFWNQLLGFQLPSYIGGLAGGLIAIPVWEFLQRIGPRNK